MARSISISPSSCSLHTEEDSIPTNPAIFNCSLKDFLRNWPKSALTWTDLPLSQSGPKRRNAAKRIGSRSRPFGACMDPLSQLTPAPMPSEQGSQAANSTGTAAIILEDKEDHPPLETSHTETLMPWTQVPQSERQSQKLTNRSTERKVAATSVPSKDTWCTTVPIDGPK
jgi:hypothetical protein